MLSSFEEALGFKLEASNLLYVLCDYETLLKKNISLESFVNLCKNKDIKLIQYKDKISSIQTQKENLIFLKNSLDIQIIVNNKIDLIEYCDGLHLGQEDFALIHKNKKLALKLIRKRIGNKLLGLSAYNELEILEANELEIDMIELGAYRKTNIDGINTILGDKIIYLAKISTHPVCATGGVKIKDKIKNITFNVVGSDFYITKRNACCEN